MSWSFPSHDSCPSPVEQHDSVPLDLAAMQYFHHYMAYTCLTLRRSDAESSYFWRSDIVKEAFKHTFLMYGLLGVAATHLTVLNLDHPDLLRTHRRASWRYQQAALTDFRSTIQEPDTDNSTAHIAFSRVIGVVTGMQHQLAWSHPHLTCSATTGSIHDIPSADPLSIARLLEYFVLFRGVGEMLLSCQPLLPHGSDFLLSEKVLEGLRGSPPPTFESTLSLGIVAAGAIDAHHPSSSTPHHPNTHITAEELSRIPFPAAVCLATLRERLAPLLDPREGSIADLHSAVDALTIAYATSFATLRASPSPCSVPNPSSSSSSSPPPPADPHPHPHLNPNADPLSTTSTASSAATATPPYDASWARWNGAEGFLRRAPARFARALASAQPGALVVFAYWLPLVQRLERDYWFVRGQAQWMLAIVMRHLPDERWRALVRGVV